MHLFSYVRLLWLVACESLLGIANLQTQSPVWKAARLKSAPTAYGQIAIGPDAIDEQGEFSDGDIIYNVVDEHADFVELSDGKSTGWVLKESLGRVEAMSAREWALRACS